MRMSLPRQLEMATSSHHADPLRLKRTFSYIRLHLQSQSPAVALRMGRKLSNACLSLADFPLRHREGVVTRS